MKVGTIVKLKVDCLGNKAGTLGVVFNDYIHGCQAIFENGNLDGFSTKNSLGDETEVNAFLEVVGLEQSLVTYKFKNVVQVATDYRKGVFNIAWSERWKLKVALIIEQGATEEKHTSRALQGLTEAWRQSDEADEKLAAEPEYEKCEVYSHRLNSYVWLMFKRGNLPLMLAAAIDFVDFSHFEYEKDVSHLSPRLLKGGTTICPLYVVFRKEL